MWWLPTATALGGVLLGWWIQTEIEAARLRRLVPPYPGVVNTLPPTTAELTPLSWGASLDGTPDVDVESKSPRGS